jgi:hypothetical protein
LARTSIRNAACPACPLVWGILWYLCCCYAREEDLYQNVMPPKRLYQQTLYAAAGRFFDRVSGLQNPISKRMIEKWIL